MAVVDELPAGMEIVVSEDAVTADVLGSNNSIHTAISVSDSELFMTKALIIAESPVRKNLGRLG